MQRRDKKVGVLLAEADAAQDRGGVLAVDVVGVARLGAGYEAQAEALQNARRGVLCGRRRGQCPQGGRDRGRHDPLGMQLESADTGAAGGCGLRRQRL